MDSRNSDRPSGELILVTGPAGSGKSVWAEGLAAGSGRPVVYIATSKTLPDDREWCDRIARHKARRPQSWKLVEESTNLAGAIEKCDSKCCLLVDSLGTWVASWLDAEEAVWKTEVDRSIAILERRSFPRTILVAEETGWGVVSRLRNGAAVSRSPGRDDPAVRGARRRRVFGCRGPCRRFARDWNPLTVDRAVGVGVGNFEFWILKRRPACNFGIP